MPSSSTSPLPPAAASNVTAVAVVQPDSPGISGTQKSKTTKKGPNSWLQGTKLNYLASLEHEWRAAHKVSGGNITTFYDRVTTQWIYMYGYDLPLEQDNPDHAVAPKTGLDKIPFLQGESDEVVLSRKAYWAHLRKVCSIF